MYPKVRNPVVSWLLSLVTGGIYLSYWVWQVATELNNAEERTVFPVTGWRNAAFALFGLTAAGAVVAFQTKNPLLFFALALCLIAFFVHVQISIGNYIKAKDDQLSTGVKFSNTMSVGLFWLVANTGVAYMQSAINRVIRHEQARS
jgi:hypothetical protein